jgi:hypothetical protein
LRPLAHVRDSEICALICEALRRFDSGAEAQAWLAEHQLLAKLSELAFENEQTTRTPAVAIVNHPTLIHYAVLANADSKITAQLVRAVESEAAGRYFPQARIWRSYASTLVSLVRKQTVVLPSLKPKGYEKVYVPYFEFMAATTGEQRGIARQQIEASFQLRNKDRRYIDWVGLDGDGEKPVNWDFRLFTLELLVQQ